MLKEVRQNPTTYALALLWVVIYLAMLVVDGQLTYVGNPLNWGAITPQTAMRFGALQARLVMQGEIWRTVTATMIHFSLVHLALNLSCLIQFGRLLESWYGSARLLAVYFAIAVLGNGFAVAGRVVSKSGLDQVCAGGSSVMFGFIALVAVVGWRSRTRFGDYIRKQMMFFLLFYGVFFGFLLRGVVDNFGHGGGAIAGAIVGFAHRRLIKDRASRPSFLLASVVLLLMFACFGAQYRLDRREAPIRERIASETDLAKRLALAKLARDEMARTVLLYQKIARNPRVAYRRDANGKVLDPLAKEKEALGLSLKLLQNQEIGGLIGEPALFDEWRGLASVAVSETPINRDLSRFQSISNRLLQATDAVLAETGQQLAQMMLSNYQSQAERPK